MIGFPPIDERFYSCHFFSKEHRFMNIVVYRIYVLLTDRLDHVNSSRLVFLPELILNFEQAGSTT